MRSTRARMLLENLESRSLLSTYKPNAKWRYPFQVVSPNPSVTPSVSDLTDTSGNPIAANDPIYYVADVGRFAASPRVAKASPAVLSYLFGTPTHESAKAKPVYEPK